MPRAAVALASNSRAGAVAPISGPRAKRPVRPGRLHLAIVALAAIGIWLMFVFAGALTELDRATTRQEGVASEAATLTQRLEADKRELQLVQTDSFQRLQARAYGMGAPGEVVFGLAPNAPSPAPIVALGSTGDTGASGSGQLPETPLDAWLELVFGN